jgi:hypothetical protein
VNRGEAVQLVSAAVGRSDPDVRHAFPLVLEVPFNEGSIGLLELKAWSQHFALRYAIFARAPGTVLSAASEALHLGVWTATDELGHSYTGVGGEAEDFRDGARWSFSAEILFAPALANRADQLQLSLPAVSGLPLPTMTVPLTRTART